jgi:hypothetical protein
VREHAAFLIDDRPLAGEIRALAGAVLAGTLAELAT